MDGDRGRSSGSAESSGEVRGVVDRVDSPVESRVADDRGGEVLRAGIVRRRRRWRWSSVAALIVVVSGLLVLRDRDAATRSRTGPTPATVEYAAVFVRDEMTLVARRPDGREQIIWQVPTEIRASHKIQNVGVRVYASAAGWVAVTGIKSEGFFFVDLLNPDRAPRFVGVIGPSGGHATTGSWNPAGTLFAAVERDRYSVVIDPATGDVTQLATGSPPVGFWPTWAADGSAILLGAAEPACVAVSADRRPYPGVKSRDLVMAPVDGGPVQDLIPKLADGRNRVYESGLWAVDNHCRVGAPFADVDSVAVVGFYTDTWVESVDVPGTIRESAFATSRPALWVLSTDPDHVFLHEVVAPTFATYGGPGTRSVRQVNRVAADNRGDPSIDLVAVAPDDSAVAVQTYTSAYGTTVGGVVTVARPGYVYLLPTDEEPAATLRGTFAGFVPVSLLDRLPAR